MISNPALRLLATAAGAKIVGVLDSHFHQDFEPIPNMPVERTSLRTTSARYSRFIEAGSWNTHGDEKPHSNFITRFTRLEIDPRTGHAGGTAQIFEVVEVRV